MLNASPLVSQKFDWQCDTPRLDPPTPHLLYVRSSLYPSKAANNNLALSYFTFNTVCQTDSADQCVSKYLLNSLVLIYDLWLCWLYFVEIHVVTVGLFTVWRAANNPAILISVQTRHVLYSVKFILTRVVLENQIGMEPLLTEL